MVGLSCPGESYLQEEKCLNRMKDETICWRQQTENMKGV